MCATEGYAKNCFATVILSANVKLVALNEGALPISRSQSEEPINRQAYRAFVRDHNVKNVCGEGRQLTQKSNPKKKGEGQGKGGPEAEPD